MKQDIIEKSNLPNEKPARRSVWSRLFFPL